MTTRWILPFLAMSAFAVPVFAANACDGPDCPSTAAVPHYVGNTEGGYPMSATARIVGGMPSYLVRYSDQNHDWSDIQEYGIDTDLTRDEYVQQIEEHGKDSPGIMSSMCPGAHAMADDGTRAYWIVIWVNKDNTLLPCIDGP